MTRALAVLAVALSACSGEPRARTDAGREPPPAPAPGEHAPPAPGEPAPPAQPPEPDDRAGLLGTELAPARVRSLLASSPVKGLRPVGTRDVVIDMRLDGPVDARFVPATERDPDAWRREIAAYRVARCLGMDNVPPAVRRELSRDELLARLDPDFADVREDLISAIRWDGDAAVGAAIYLPRDARPSGLTRGRRLARRFEDLSLGVDVDPDRRALLADLAHAVLFDYLVAHRGRFDGGAVPGVPSGARIYALGHADAFAWPLPAAEHAELRDHLVRVEKLAPWFAQGLSRCDLEGAGVSAFLDEARLESLRDRRMALVTYVLALTAEHGERAVLSLP